MARDIDIQVLPDPGDIVFDDAGTPILSFEENRPDHGSGWVLSYLDGSDGVDERFIGGTIEDLDWAETSARDWMQRVGSQEA